MSDVQRFGRAFWFSGLVALGLVLALAVVLFFVAQRSGIEDLEELLRRVAPSLLLWRLGLFVALMLYWRELVGGLARLAKLDGPTTSALHGWRTRAGTGLVVMDLLLVEDTVGWLARLVF